MSSLIFRNLLIEKQIRECSDMSPCLPCIDPISGAALLPVLEWAAPQTRVISLTSIRDQNYWRGFTSDQPPILYNALQQPDLAAVADEVLQNMIECPCLCEKVSLDHV